MLTTSKRRIDRCLRTFSFSIAQTRRKHRSAMILYFILRKDYKIICRIFFFNKLLINKYCDNSCDKILWHTNLFVSQSVFPFIIKHFIWKQVFQYLFYVALLAFLPVIEEYATVLIKHFVVKEQPCSMITEILMPTDISKELKFHSV